MLYKICGSEVGIPLSTGNQKYSRGQTASYFQYISNSFHRHLQPRSEARWRVRWFVWTFLYVHTNIAKKTPQNNSQNTPKNLFIILQFKNFFFHVSQAIHFSQELQWSIFLIKIPDFVLLISSNSESTIFPCKLFYLLSCSENNVCFTGSCGIST